MKDFDKHLQEILASNPEANQEYAKQFAKLPLQTQLAIMRRRKKLSQRALAKRLKTLQPHIARTESAKHDPRLSSVVRAAKAVGCRVVLIPDDKISKLFVA